MRAVLDTNLLIDASVDHAGFDVSVSSLSWAELRHGVRAARDETERAKREILLGRLRALLGEGLPFDDQAAEAYASICGAVMAHGRSVRGRVVDLMIAATAASHGAAVITRNPGDFEGLDSVVHIVAR